MSIDPRDYEVDEKERERREKVFDRQAAGGGDKRPELPEDLSRLMWAILDKGAIRMGEPDQEPYMFGRFEAFDCKVGGMGMVLEARDPRLDRKVAIKLWQATGPGAEAALLAEAKIPAKLSHPNVVGVHEIGEWRDRVYFVMEWVDGQDGHEWLQQPRTWEEVQEVFVGAGEGLAAVHDAGIFHQDFKPANLLIARTGRVLVADFGIADMLHSMVGELLGQPSGTLPYMAPERLRGERGDARSDQFSFCVALWEALHGFRPFSGNTREELLDAIESNTLRGDPRADRVPLWISRIAVKGLDPDPDRRFDDMHELVDALIGEAPVSRELDAKTTAGGPKNTKRRVLNSPGAARHDSPGSLRRRWPWVAAAGFGVGVAFALGMVMAVPSAEADECEEVMSELAPVWNNEVQAELRGAFGTRKVGDALQGWASRWLAVRAQECEAAKSDLRDTGVTPCTATVRERFEATVRAFRVPHLREGLHVAAVIAELPEPEHCIDHPDDNEWGYGGLLELRDLEFEVEVLVGIGDLDVARARQNDYMELAWELQSNDGIARAIFWRAEIHRLEAQLDDAAQDFELAFEKATGPGMELFAAKVLLKLAAIAGARGEFEVMDAFALGARKGFVEHQPERIAELLQVQGLALVSGPEAGRERGVALLLHAVERRETELSKQPMGMRELLSQAHENYARGLLAVHRASEALEYLDLALTVHQEESGHGTWRTHGILRQKFLALVELRRLDSAESVERMLLKLARDDEDWRRYTEDAFWLANTYNDAGEARRVADVLRFGRARAVEHGLLDDIARFDRTFEKFVGE